MLSAALFVELYFVNVSGAVSSIVYEVMSCQGFWCCQQHCLWSYSLSRFLVLSAALFVE